MICPACGHPDTSVQNSDHSLDGKEVIRLRVCRQCGARWPTREIDARRLGTPLPRTRRAVARAAVIRIHTTSL